MKYASGVIKKVYAIRIEPDEDILLSIQKFCEDNHIGNGVIVSGIGSVKKASFYDPQEIPGKPGNYGYVTPIDVDSPMELVSMNGIICTDDEGKVSLHIHADFADPDGRAAAGHLKEGNFVLATVELVIAEFDHIGMRRTYDPEKGVPIFKPVQE